LIRSSAKPPYDLVADEHDHLHNVKDTDTVDFYSRNYRDGEV